MSDLTKKIQTGVKKAMSGDADGDLVPFSQNHVK